MHAYVWRIPLAFLFLPAILASSADAAPGSVGQYARLNAAPSARAATSGTLVLPGEKTLLAGYVEYNAQTCAEISMGAWTVNTAPQYGKTSFGEVKSTLSNGACPGKIFTFAAIYYTLDKSTSASSDSLAATWTSPDFTVPLTFDLVIPTVTFVSQDITQDSIVVDPEPSGASGTLTITAVGTQASPQVANQSVSGGAQVSLKYGETTSPLPASHYTRLKAKWDFPKGSVEGSTTVNFTALGLYENTQYNRPHESSCAGQAQAVTLYNAACHTKARNFLSGFVSQVDLNGTGVPNFDVNGYVHTEAFCTTGPTDFRYPYNSLGSCHRNTGALNDTTLAVNFNTAAHFQCDDQVFFVGENPSGNVIGTTKTVTDTCPGCGAVNGGQAGHVDNFTTVPDCQNVPSLPDYQAIIVGR